MSVTTVGYVDKFERDGDWYDIEDTLFRNTKGQANGLAELGSDGKVPSSQLPTIPSAQVQSDYTQNDDTKVDYIKNKPTLGTAAALDVPSSGNASTSQVVKGNDTRLTDARNAADVSAWAKATTKPSYTASEVGLGNVDNTSDATKKTNFTGSIASGNTGFVTGGDAYNALTGKLSTALKGANNGLAELGSDGKVPTSQLPSYVDDVIEVADYSHLPITGEAGKIYITLDTNLEYRWSGTTYAQISKSLALGETSETAYRGDRGKTAYDHATETKLGTATTSGFYKVAGTAQGHIASLTAVEKSDITGLGIPDTDENVKQSPSTDNATYEVLFSGSADNTEHTEGIKKSNRFQFNPNKGALMEGSNTLASGNYSHAEGSYTSATNEASHAEGTATSASGLYSHAEGYMTIANGYSSHAEGNGTTANYDNSHAEGELTKTTGSGSHSEGYKTTVSGNYSHAEGYATCASSGYSHAEGRETVSQNNYSHTEGYKTTTSTYGIYAHAEGNFTKAYGTASHTEGNSTSASSNYSHAEGNATSAKGIASHAEGSSATSFGDYSHAEGTNTISNGAYSHAEGNQTSSIGTMTHAEGSKTSASGNYSHAEGYMTTSNGAYSHAEGNGTYTNGYHSHAEGNGTNAIGDNSHAEGYSTTSAANYSHAEGVYTCAAGEGQHVSGKYNIPDTTSLFIIGNGTAHNARSNAMTVDATGNMNITKINGVTVGDSPKFTDHTYNFSGGNFYSGLANVEEHNANNMATNGHYYYTSNGPSQDIGASTADGSMYVQAYSTTWVSQIAQDYRNGNLFVRGKNNGTWKDWHSVTTGEFIAAARYGESTNDGTKKTKITINSTTDWMLTFTVTLYQGYSCTKIMISGYQYGNNYWYSPKAVILGKSHDSNVNVYFGYDSVNHLWVGFDGSSYRGISVSDVTNGYTQIKDYGKLFTISTVDTLTTLQTTITAIEGVRQTDSNGNANYRVLLSETAVNDTKTEATRKSGNLVFNPSTGILSTNRIELTNYVSAPVLGVTSATGTSGGISLFNGTGSIDTYGICFRYTSDKGKHGYVQADWATYLTMNNTTGRGWIFKNSDANVGNVASISNVGHAVFNGSVTVGGNATNTSGARMEYNSTNRCIDFVFV